MAIAPFIFLGVVALVTVGILAIRAYLKRQKAKKLDEHAEAYAIAYLSEARFWRDTHLEYRDDNYLLSLPYVEAVGILKSYYKENRAEVQA